MRSDWVHKGHCSRHLVDLVNLEELDSQCITLCSLGSGLVALVALVSFVAKKASIKTLVV